MKSAQRRNAIVDVLMANGSASVDELADRLMVSRMTIYRDLDQLEAHGLLRKVRGGASVHPSNRFESSFRYRSRLNEAAKRAIVAAARELVELGQAILIDDGSTAGMLAEQLREQRSLTVITNNLQAIQYLADIEGIELIVLGGSANSQFNGCFGMLTEQALASIRADIAFMSPSTICDGAAYHQNQEVAKTKKAMMAAAEQRYLLADSSKFGRTALYLLSSLSAFDEIITDREPDPRQRAAIDKLPVQVRVVGSGES